MSLVDMEGYLLDSNPALSEMLKFSKEELHLKSFKALTHPDDIAESVTLFRELTSGKGNLTPGKNVIFAKMARSSGGR